MSVPANGTTEHSEGEAARPPLRRIRVSGLVGRVGRVGLRTRLGLVLQPEGGRLGRLDRRPGLDQPGLTVGVALGAREASLLTSGGLLRLPALTLALPEAVRHAIHDTELPVQLTRDRSAATVPRCGWPWSATSNGSSSRASTGSQRLARSSTLLRPGRAPAAVARSPRSSSPSSPARASSSRRWETIASPATFGRIWGP